MKKMQLQTFKYMFKILHTNTHTEMSLFYNFGGADLYSSMTAEVKVKFIGMSDVRINSSTSRNVSTASNLTITK